MACTGKNPITDEERYAIWKWAKEHGGVDDGFPLHSVANAINNKFYGGMAPAAWLDDILSGRKTPLKEVATDMWKKQYNRRVITQMAKEVSQTANMGTTGKILRGLWTLPRTVAVAGHGIVFPITHGGDLAFRPASWGTLIKGALRTYRGALVPSKFGGGKAYTARILNRIEGDSMYDIGLRSGVDMGANSHPSGLISRSYKGPAQRAWDLLTVMRFELWKNQMGKFVKPGMSPKEVLDIGTHLADWANKATGSAKGPIANIGGEALFGPKLTQSKLSRVFADPVTTSKTFYKMARGFDTTAGERAVAWTRLSGATQFLVTNLGFLGVNAGLLYALGSKDKINFTDPMKGDFMAFKGGGILGNVPGMHTEIRTLAKILATAFAGRKELRGESKFGATAKIGGQYAMGKLTPTIGHSLELGFGQDWMGRPLPWSKDEGTANKPRMTYGEFAASIGPIPAEGPIGYVYDKLREGGTSALDATAITKALIIGGLGAPGFHVREDYQSGRGSAIGTTRIRNPRVVR